jgi:hypothetical protein
MYDYVVGAERKERIAITLMAARKERLNPCVGGIEGKGAPAREGVDAFSGDGTVVRASCRERDLVSLHVDPYGYEGWSIEEGNLVGNFYGSCDPCGNDEDPRWRYENVRADLAAAGAPMGRGPCTLLPRTVSRPGSAAGRRAQTDRG